VSKVRSPESDPYLAPIEVDHPLLDALDSIGLKLNPKFQIESLKPQKNVQQKSAIYHVKIQSTSNTSVVAKRSKIAAGTVERIVYENILPLLSLTSPRYYGFTHEKNGDYCWLFLEYIHGVPLSPENESHRRAAAQWLGRLHASAASIPSALHLPDGGPDRYLGHLRSARLVIRQLRDQTDFVAISNVLMHLIDLLDRLQESWESIATYCNVMPHTLIHGDFIPKNIRVVGLGEEISIYPFDWELAGFGVPVADLSETDIPEYADEVIHLWPVGSIAEVRQWALVGRVFRLLASIDWSCASLRWGWDTESADDLIVYDTRLGQVLHHLNFAGVTA
jgi:aminoglycoside phosphotransferase (APT) family kinase protein